MLKDYKPLDRTKKILVTGGAGFIGFHFSKKLLETGCRVVGFDNLNEYYDVKLKYDRLAILQEFEQFQFIKGDLADKNALEQLFEAESNEARKNVKVDFGNK